MKRVAVLIPAYNEARSLPALLRRINTRIYHVVVVDDGSVDSTSSVVAKGGATLIRNAVNIGTGASIARALRQTPSRAYDVIVLMDADGQHDPSQIRNLVREVRKGADYVIGSRYVQRMPHATTPLRVLGTMIISYWLRVWFGKLVRDPTSGFRAISRRAFVLFSHRYPEYFSEPSAIIAAVENGLSIVEIPCIMQQRKYGTSSISSVRALFMMAYILVLIPYRALSGLMKRGNISG